MACRVFRGATRDYERGQAALNEVGRVGPEARLTDFGTLCKVCPMTAAPPLYPTLWRNCRAFANRTCLQIFTILVRQPALTVSAVANCPGAFGRELARQAGGG